MIAVCKDLPNWEDGYGITCAKLEEFGNCKDGKLGNGLSTNRLDKDVEGTDFKDWPAYKACCACGGGFKGMVRV